MGNRQTKSIHTNAKIDNSSTKNTIITEYGTKEIITSDLLTTPLPNEIKPNTNTSIEIPINFLLSSPTSNDVYITRPDSLQWIPQSNAREDILEHFIKVKELGRGASGYVCEVKSTINQKNYALKCVKRSNEWSSVLFETEVKFLIKLKNYTGINKIIDFFMDNQYFFLLTEIANTDLFQRIKSEGRINENEARTIARELLQTLAFMDELNVVHRDLKPENIAFLNDNKNQPILIDFGDACLVVDTKIYSEIVGTACYMAPERLKPHIGKYLKKSDVWSVGVIVYEMVTGRRCFHGKTLKKLFDKISCAKYSFPKDLELSPLCYDFINCLLDINLLNRPLARTALRHPWLILADINDTNLSTETLSKPNSISSTIPNILNNIIHSLPSNKASSKFKDIIIQKYINELTDDDLKSAHDIFYELDTNRDNYIDINDLSNSLTQNSLLSTESLTLIKIIIQEFGIKNNTKIPFEDFIIVYFSYQSGKNKSVAKPFTELSKKSSFESSSQSNISRYISSQKSSESLLFSPLTACKEELYEFIDELDIDKIENEFSSNA